MINRETIYEMNTRGMPPYWIRSRPNLQIWGAQKVENDDILVPNVYRNAIDYYMFKHNVADAIDIRFAFVFL